MQCDNTADNKQGRCSDLGRSYRIRQAAKSRGNHPLVKRGALLDQGCWCVVAQTMVNHLAADRPKARQSHIDHNRLPGLAQSIPVKINAAVLKVSGDKKTGLRVIPMGEGDACVTGASGRRGDAGNDLKRDVVSYKILNFLTPSAKDERVAAL